MFLNDLTGEVPVRFVYKVPVLASVRAAKQNISWAAQALWAGIIKIDFGLGKNNVSMLVVC